MHCPLENQESSAQLLAFTSGRLEPGSAARMEQHIAECSACQAFARQQAALWDTLDIWEAPPVSPDFDRKLHERIAQRVSWWDMFVRPLRPLFEYRTLPLAAAAGLLIMAGVLLDRPAAGPVPAPPETAQVQALQPDQVEHAVDEVEMISQFDRLMRSDPADSNSKM